MKKTYRLDYTKNYKDQTSRKQTTQWGGKWVLDLNRGCKNEIYPDTQL